MIDTFIDEIEYKKAFKEVDEILKYIPDEELSKIPSEILISIKENMQLDYEFKINDVSNFENIEISEISKAILYIIYRDYWASEEERKELELNEKNQRNIIENKKREKYNPDDVFKNKKRKIMDNNIKENISLVKYDENVFNKIINYLKKIFFNKN